jgi:hypothetical protein
MVVLDSTPGYPANIEDLADNIKVVFIPLSMTDAANGPRGDDNTQNRLLQVDRAAAAHRERDGKDEPIQGF